MSPRLKILHIISSWQSVVGNELAEFAPRLAQDEFEVEMCVLANSTISKTPHTPTTTLGLRWAFDISTYFGVGRIIRRFRPDVIHTWDNTAQLYAAFHPGKHRIIAEKREPEAKTGILQKYANDRTHCFIAPRRIDDCPKTIAIPPAAVPAAYAQPIPATELLAKLEIPLVEPSGDYYPVLQSRYEPERRNYKPVQPHSTPFLICIALPLCSEHRILDALWTFETLNQLRMNFHAFIIGDGKDRELLLRYRDRWKLFSRVHFLGNQCDAYKLLPSCDVLLHLSSSAAHSGTILSAMSCGVPVVALETPESREHIVDGTTGMLIPCDGDFRFYRRISAKKLLYLLENVELRRAMHDAAKERVAKEYNFDAAVQERIRLYKSMS